MAIKKKSKKPGAKLEKSRFYHKNVEYNVGKFLAICPNKPKKEDRQLTGRDLELRKAVRAFIAENKIKNPTKLEYLKACYLTSRKEWLEIKAARD